MKSNPPLSTDSHQEDRRQRKIKLLIPVLGVIAFHAIPISGLLLIGCKRDAQQVATTLETERNDEIPMLDTGELYQGLETESPHLAVQPETTMPSQSWQEQSFEPTMTPEILPEESRQNETLPMLPETALPMVPENPPVRNVRNENDRNDRNENDPRRGNVSESADYQIQRGDRLYSLARRFGIPLDDLMSANPGIDPRRLRVGQSIRIPKSIPKSTPSTRSRTNGKTYLVKRGDTLTRIARQNGVSIRALKRANSLTSDRILVGQRLRIPVAEMASATR